MMGSYQANRAWSDASIGLVINLVGPRLLVPASVEHDTKYATDLIVLTARDMRIAARVRRFGYAERYPYEFTIRSKSMFGHLTEINKILNGFGDWFIYAHASQDGSSLSRWWLLDLREFRRQIMLEKGDMSELAKHQSNNDGTEFLAFDVRKFDPQFVIDSSHGLPLKKREQVVQLSLV